MIVEECEIAKGFRVVIRETEGALHDTLPYSITVEQHYSTYAHKPDWECDPDGWRTCVALFAKCREDADAEYRKLIESEKRYH